MRWHDNCRYCWQALYRHKVRTLLLLIAVAIGVTSVLLLTSLGEGAKRFIEQEFSSLGNQILVVLPGKKETTGGSVPIYGTSPRDLTLDDANTLKTIPTIRAIAPIIAGTALVSHQGLSREVITIGSTPDFFHVRNLSLSAGQNLPQTSEELASAVCILGARIKQELFGNNNAIGQWIRFSGQKFRIIGILQERGESMGLDLREMAIIPIRAAESLFNSPGLFRILIELRQAGSESYTEQQIRQKIKERHEGEDDISILSQKSLITSFSRILTLVTASIGAIAAISLIVAGFLIMNVSYISVSRRREEIGLLKAIGATSVEIRTLFLTESLLLVGVGVALGIIFGYGTVILVSKLWPVFPIAIPWWATLAASLIALIIGLLFSWLPAAQAARHDPVLALKGD